MARPSDPHAKSRLLEAAERVFSEKGLDRAKVEDITTSAGLSKGAFYLHFESKGDAFKELLSDVLGHLKDRLEEAKANCSPKPGQGPEDVLQMWIEKDLEMFEFIWQNRALMRMTLEGGRSADYQHLIDYFVNHVEHELEVMLRVGVEAGIYRQDLDLGIAAAFVAGGYDRYVRKLVRETRKPDIAHAIRQLQRMVVGGAGTPEFATIPAESSAAPRAGGHDDPASNVDTSSFLSK
ncbi:MAG TPA: TetR/AcrR family transcriptional regulator [Polyangiaceae bacterium]|jgi:AcrR family transcriptional regulator